MCYKDVLRAMKREANLTDSLSGHPCIVQILGTAEDSRVFVMERAVSDLYTIVKQQETRLPLGHAKNWAEHMLAATSYIHSQGIVHQDIKSSNVLIFANKVAKLCDFGLAKKGSDIMVVDRELVTLWYRAPELLMGDDTYTMKVDEWGVGCVLLEMMIGVPPFKGKPACVCSCSQITHRNFNSDQLMKIFLTVGSPEKRSTLACTDHLSRWPKFPRKLDSILQRVITADRLAKDGVSGSCNDVAEALKDWTRLIGNMLTLTPQQRMSAAQVLETSFFKSSAIREDTSPTSYPADMSPKMSWICPTLPTAATISREVGAGTHSSLHHSVQKRDSSPEISNDRVSPEDSASGQMAPAGRPTPSRRISFDVRDPHTLCPKGNLPRVMQEKFILVDQTPSRTTSTGLPISRSSGVDEKKENSNLMSTIRSRVEGLIRLGGIGLGGQRSRDMPTLPESNCRGIKSTRTQERMSAMIKITDGSRIKRQIHSSPVKAAGTMPAAESDDQTG